MRRFTGSLIYNSENSADSNIEKAMHHIYKSAGMDSREFKEASF
jgi:hypothetical protein